MVEKQDSIRVGIAGAGLMGFWHAKIAQKEGARVVAVMDPKAESAEKLARRFPEAQPIVGDDLPSRLESPVDVWHICTPLPSHRRLTEAALRAGAHVLVEKPLTATTAETEQLLSLAAEKGLHLCPVHQFPFQAGVRQALRRLPQIGPLFSLHFTVRSAGGEGLTTDQADHIAASIFPHPLSLIAALLPGRLADISWQAVSPQTAEWLVMGSADGTGITIEISMNGRPTANRCQIVGHGGTAHLDLFHGYAVFEDPAVSRTRKLTHPFSLSARHFLGAAANLGRRAVRGESAYPGLRPLIRDFYAAVKNGTPAPIPPSEIIAIARASEQIQAQGQQ